MSEDAQPAQTTETTGTQLVSPWSWWYSPRGRNSKPDASGNYELNLTKLGDVRTLEEFFSYYCFLKKPSEVPIDHKILFFEKDAIPAWENWPEGGCWILQIKKRGDPHQYNLKWERLLFALIGNEFTDAGVIGVVLSVRQKKNLIEIWIKSALSEDQRIKAGEKIRETLELDPQHLIFYFKEHSKSLKEGSTLRGVEHYSFISTPIETPMGTPVQKTVQGGIIPPMEDL